VADPSAAPASEFGDRHHHLGYLEREAIYERVTDGIVLDGGGGDVSGHTGIRWLVVQRTEEDRSIHERVEYRRNGYCRGGT